MSGLILIFLVALGIGLLIELERERSKGRVPAGLRTFALVALLGALALTEPLLADAIAVTVAALLAGTPVLHRFVRGTLTDAEVSDGLVLAIASIVVWPVLPDRAMARMARSTPICCGSW